MWRNHHIWFDRAYPAEDIKRNIIELFRLIFLYLQVDHFVQQFTTSLDAAKSMSGRALRQRLCWIRDLENILRDWLTSLKLDRDRARSMLDRVKARHALKHQDGGISSSARRGCGRSSGGLRSMTGQSGSSRINVRWNKPLTGSLRPPAGFADLYRGGTPNGNRTRVFTVKG